MRKLLGLLVVAVFFLICISVNIGNAQGKELWSSGEVFLFASGIRVTSSIGKTVEESLFVIKIGDTSLAEMETAFWGGIFPGHAPSKTLYSRAQKGQDENWRAMTFRRPASLKEVKDFESPEGYKKFSSEKLVKKSELPPPINKLELTELSRIGFLVVYFAGGIEIRLVDGTAFEGIRELAEKIASLKNREKPDTPVDKERSIASTDKQNIPSDFETWTRLGPTKVDYNGDKLVDIEITTFLDPRGDEKNTRMVEIHKATQYDFSFLVYIEKAEDQVLPPSYWQQKNGQWVNIREEEMDKKWAEYLKYLALPKKGVLI